MCGAVIIMVGAMLPRTGVAEDIQLVKSYRSDIDRMGEGCLLGGDGTSH
jgi:hypothetical protein